MCCSSIFNDILLADLFLVEQKSMKCDLERFWDNLFNFDINNFVSSANSINKINSALPQISFIYEGGSRSCHLAYISYDSHTISRILRTVTALILILVGHHISLLFL